jgi:hypothetical protein
VAFFAGCRGIVNAAVMQRPTDWWSSERPWQQVDTVGSYHVGEAAERLASAVQHLVSTMTNEEVRPPPRDRAALAALLVAALAPGGPAEEAFLQAVRRDLRTGQRWQWPRRAYRFLRLG